MELVFGSFVLLSVLSGQTIKNNPYYIILNPPLTLKKFYSN